MADQSARTRPPKTVRTGAAAAASGRAFLVGEYGSEEALERAMDAGYEEIAASMTPEELAERRALSASRRARLAAIEAAEDDES